MRDVENYSDEERKEEEEKEMGGGGLKFRLTRVDSACRECLELIIGEHLYAYLRKNLIHVPK